MTRISVLMPVRDGEKYLTRALKSTLKALGDEDEVLVFDDASRDRTAEQLSAFVDPRVKVFRTKNQVGIGEGLNTLLAFAKGNFIARMDADDVCLPWRFERQVSELRKREADVLFNSAFYFGSRSLVHPVHFRDMNNHLFTAALTEWCPGIHPTMLARRNVFDSGVRYSSQPQEDYELWIRLAIQGWQFSRDSMPVLLYRLHSTQVSKSKTHQASLDKNENIRKLQEELCAKFKENNGLTAGESIRFATSDSLLLRLEHLGLRRFLGREMRIGEVEGWRK